MIKKTLSKRTSKKKSTRKKKTSKKNTNMTFYSSEKFDNDREKITNVKKRELDRWIKLNLEYLK